MKKIKDIHRPVPSRIYISEKQKDFLHALIKKRYKETGEVTSMSALIIEFIGKEMKNEKDNRY